MDPKKYGRVAQRRPQEGTQSAKVIAAPRTILSKTKSVDGKQEKARQPVQSTSKQPVSRTKRKIISESSSSESVGEPSSSESVGEPSSSESDSESTGSSDYDTPKKKTAKKAAPKKAKAAKATKQLYRDKVIVPKDTIKPAKVKTIQRMVEWTDSDSDSESTITPLSDVNFSKYIGDVDSYKDSNVIEYRMPKSENTLSFVKCPHNSCNRVLTGMSERFQQEIDNAQRQSNKQYGRNMTTSQYNLFVSTTYDKYGNVFNKGGLDRSVTIYNDDTKRDIANYRENFIEANKREMTVDEYNTYIESITMYEGKYANYVDATKRAFMEHFGRVMKIGDYEDYSGDSDNTLGKMTRKLVSTYTDDITDDEYNLLVDKYASTADKTVSQRQVDFYKAYGREMIRYQVFNSDTGALKRITSTNTVVLQDECCRINIMQRVVIPQGRDFNDRNIDEEGERQGNVVRKKFTAPVPYNPFTFANELAKMQTDAPVRQIKGAKSTHTKTPTISVADDVESRSDSFPLMPDTTGFDFEEEVYDPFIVKTREIVTHKVFTGVKGMETYRIAGRTIVAR